MNKKYTLKGINNDSDTCEICGKVELKRVMWLAELDADGGETHNIIAAGTTCGAVALGLNGNYKSVEEVVAAVEERGKREVSYNKAYAAAKKYYESTGEEVAIVYNNGSYNMARGRAIDASPYLYKYCHIEWPKF